MRRVNRIPASVLIALRMTSTNACAALVFCLLPSLCYRGMRLHVGNMMFNREAPRYDHRTYDHVVHVLELTAARSAVQRCSLACYGSRFHEALVERASQIRRHPSVI